MTKAGISSPVWLKPRRVAVIARHTFTQLARMKVFYFLGVFAVITLASNFFDLPQHMGPESAGVDVLRSIKSWSIGTMTLFSVVLSITATALLIPKDVEDRTLYTILAKPVPRIDYLAGKLLGVASLVFVSLVAMDALMTAVLAMRTNFVLADQMAYAAAVHSPRDVVESMRADVLVQGPTWNLQGAVVAVFLRSVVVASMALLISTFSTSTLFTCVVGFLAYFIGHFPADARDAILHGGPAGVGPVVLWVNRFVAAVFPDFQMFNVIDAVIEGKLLSLAHLGRLAVIAGFHSAMYLVGSWFLFSKKEF
jgi:hypothetical protein